MKIIKENDKNMENNLTKIKEKYKETEEERKVREKKNNENMERIRDK